MKTIALTEETLPRAMHSSVRSVVTRSRPQSSALMTSMPAAEPSGAAGRPRPAGGVSGRVMQYVPQPLELIAPPQLDELRRHGPVGAPQHRPGVAGEHQSPAEHVGSALHLMNASKHLERRMAAEQIILPPPVEQSQSDVGVVSAAHVAMVKAHFVLEAACLPPLRAGTENRDQVDAAGAHGRVAADGLEAFAPKQLTRARHVLRALEPIGSDGICLAVGGAGDSEPRLLRELADEELDIVRLER